ncbi:hypothetical protein NGM33_28320 [Nocardiopsis dassonvillei]|uniref:hypothetical protein n=1 Tax=Nocardiopsis dassonvillei TaxID=2014 RepID=UPI00102D1657|nr:hypothetical protein [Nocardiopsis dassonvillei]MCP3017241.1 hypothetical protein [Nocardiopsis dassonvillei]
MGDPSAHAAPDPRDPLTRLRLRANRSERGRKVFFGLYQGLSFGCAMGFARFLLSGSDPWTSLLHGVIAGVVFSSFMALFATPPRPRVSRDPAAQAAIAPETLRAATDRLILGRPGTDPEANRVAALQAEQVLNAPSVRIPVAVAALVAAVCSLGALALPSDEAMDFPRALLGAVALACVLTPCFLLPVRLLHRRRSREFLALHTPSDRDRSDSGRD